MSRRIITYNCKWQKFVFILSIQLSYKEGKKPMCSRLVSLSSQMVRFGLSPWPPGISFDPSLVFIQFYLILFVTPISIFLSTSKLITFFLSHGFENKDPYSIAQSMEHIRDKQKYPTLATCFLPFFSFVYLLLIRDNVCLWRMNSWSKKDIQAEWRGERWKRAAWWKAQHNPEDFTIDWHWDPSAKVSPFARVH